MGKWKMTKAASDNMKRSRFDSSKWGLPKRERRLGGYGKT